MDDELSDNFDIFEKDYECKIIMQTGAVACQDKNESDEADADFSELEKALSEEPSLKEKAENNKQIRADLGVDSKESEEAAFLEAFNVDIEIHDIAEGKTSENACDFLEDANFSCCTDISCGKENTDFQALHSDFAKALTKPDRVTQKQTKKSKSEYDSHFDELFVSEELIKSKNADFKVADKNRDNNRDNVNTQKEHEYDSILKDSFIGVDSNHKKPSEKTITTSLQSDIESEYDDILKGSFESINAEKLQQKQESQHKEEKKESEYDHLLSDLFE